MEVPLTAPARPHEALLLELGYALGLFGTTDHRVERVLSAVARRIGLEASFFAVPTGLMAWFGPVGDQRAGMKRLESTTVDLGKLARLDAVTRQLVVDGDVDAALFEVRETIAAPSAWPVWVEVAGFAVASTTGALFFGGGAPELAVAGSLGGVIGLLAVALGRHGQGQLEAVLCATVAAFVATAAPALLGPLRSDVVLVGGLLYLLPGLTLTMAVSELANRNLVAGTARLMAALLTLVQLAFGVALGRELGFLVPGTGDGPVPVEVWSTGLVAAAVAVAGLSFGVLFRARVKDLPVIMAGCGVAFAAARWGTLAFNPHLGAFLGALAVGLVSNLYARVADRPALVPLVPGVLMLVPGSLGLRSVVGLLDDDTLRAVNTGFETGIVAIALSTGLLVASGLLPARRDL